MKLVGIEIVEDRTAESRCDEGFLKLRRLRLRNVYEDRVSEVYPCDVVSRPGSDAVVAVLYERGADGRVHVWLREAPRAPIYLRRWKRFHHPDEREYLTIAEVVAGLVEPGDGEGAAGMRQRAAIEAREEAGFAVEAAEFAVIGGETFASPGTSDEKVYYCAGPVRAAERTAAHGDGTVMEEARPARALRARRGDRGLPARRDPRHEDGARADAALRPPRLPAAARLLRATSCPSRCARATAGSASRPRDVRRRASPSIGARRVRQGLGPFVARHLVALGAEVPCFLGTRPRDDRRERARARRARLHGPRGAARAGAARRARHPLALGDARALPRGRARGARARAVREAAALERRRPRAPRGACSPSASPPRACCSRESCQWPYTLPAYRALHPGAGPPRSFAMRLSPAAHEPRQMLGDSLSHPLSLLQALAGVRRARRGGRARGAARARWSCASRIARATCSVASEVAAALEPIGCRARPAYAVNGHWAEREIRPSDYAFRFRGRRPRGGRPRPAAGAAARLPRGAGDPRGPRPRDSRPDGAPASKFSKLCRPPSARARATRRGADPCIPSTTSRRSSASPR